jgi:hypothetical protein
MLEVLKEVNAGNDKPLSTYLIRDMLLTDHKKKLTNNKKELFARCKQNWRGHLRGEIGFKEASSEQNVAILKSPEHEQKVTQRVVFDNIKQKMDVYSRGQTQDCGARW